MTESDQTLHCPVCAGPIVMALTKKQNGIHLRCRKSGKHFRGFIMDGPFVADVMRRAEALGQIASA